MLIDTLLLLYMGRGLTFYYDDWNFVTQDFGGGAHSLLLAHVGNISIFPIAVYKVLFHLAGLNHYAVYRIVVIGLHLLSAGCIFVLSSRRIPRVPALLAMSLVLFLGAAWEDLLWAFQVGYMLSVAGALVAWVLLEREDRLGDLSAMLCLVVAAGSSSLGIPIMFGVAVELAWQRQWRRGWLIAVPAMLYLLWYAGYGQSQVTAESLIHAPGFVADLAAAAFGGLIGRALEWGRPLALFGLLAVVFRLLRSTPITPRLAGLIATALSLWTVTAVARSTISAPETSRYIYFGAVVIVLIGVELLREVTVTPRAAAIAAPLVIFCAFTGLTVLHAGSMGLRETSEIVKAELGALELAAVHAPPGYQPDIQRAPQITAGPYLHTVRAMGSSPADTPNEILASSQTARADADGVLIALEYPMLTRVSDTAVQRSSVAPTILSTSRGSLFRREGCVMAAAHVSENASSTFNLTRNGVLISNTGNTVVSVAIKRFNVGFYPLTSTIEPRGSAVLSVQADSGDIPWVVQVSSFSSLSVCGIRGK